MVNAISQAAFNPVLTGALVYLLAFAPDKCRLPVLEALHARLPAAISLQRVLTALKTLCALGLVGRLNAKLNDVALSNWKWSAQTEKWRWNSEIAVVTGGSMGLGKALVKELYAKGMRIAILDVAELPVEFRDKSRIMYCKCDVSDRSAVQEAAKTIRAGFGDPSILINNAGIAAHSSILKSDPGKVEKIFHVNAISHFWTVQEFLPSMVRNNKGHIMAIASMGSFATGPGMSHYCCTKAAVLAFQETLLSEMKHVYKTPDVLVSTVHPNYMATPMMDAHGSKINQNMKPEAIMSPEFVSQHAVRQILRCRGGQIILPQTLDMKIATVMRALPNWMYEAARDPAIRADGIARDL